MLVYTEQAVSVAGKPRASSNDLSTAAAAGVAVGVMAAVMTVGVAAAVVWMWRRQWVLPCASNADMGKFYHSFRIRLLKKGENVGCGSGGGGWVGGVYSSCVVGSVDGWVRIISD